MKAIQFRTIKEVFLYLKEKAIQNVEIRFLDSKLIMRSFSLNSKGLSPKIFTSNYFKFNGFSLLGIDINRAFKDPFLSHSTLVFFTNMVEHNRKLMSLRQQQVGSPYLVDFYINTENSYRPYSYCPPPFDNNREIRDEITLAVACMGVVVSSSFYKEGGCNIVALQAKNNLDLLDSIEKIKYAILMVASVYNQKIDITKGIFTRNLLLE